MSGSSKNILATPTKNSTRVDDSWKRLQNENEFLTLSKKFDKIALIQSKWETKVSVLRANPNASKSRSHSAITESREPSPSKKPRVEDAVDPPTAQPAREKPLSKDWKGDREREAVTKIGKAWRQLLKQPDEPESQGSTGINASSVHSTYDKQDSKLKFKIGTTLNNQLAFLKLRQAEGSVTEKLKEQARKCCDDWAETKENKSDPLVASFEKSLTQPFVNEFMKEALPHLRNYAKPKLIQKATELKYYCETDQKKVQNGPRRKPDGLIYIAGEECVDPKLTQEAQELGALVAVECKTDLQEKKLLNQALREIERDAAEKARLENVFQPETLCGLISDGISWQFHHFRWEMDIAKRSWAFLREESPTFLLEKNMDDIVDWLAFSLKRSLEHPGKEREGLKVNMKWGEATITQVFDPAPIRPRVIGARMASGKEFMIKFFDFIDDGIPEERRQKVANRLMKERKYLKELHDCPSFVSLVDEGDPLLGLPDTLAKYVLCMEHAGTALPSLIVSGKAGKHLARIVFTDIWEGALRELQKRKLCFADIHPGNICVKMENGTERARLIDLESIKPVTEKLDDSPILLREHAPTNGALDWDKASVAAILCCLWNDGHLDNLKNYVDSFKDRDELRKFMEAFQNEAHDQ